ncbi:MAG: hypothetical protein PF569_04075 [Candidatus Woesearchaeota archaeon]|jgi:hypothetical protein|nr:hypothetical protein [Candidatus Woesearchaeota archaeon]
MIKKILLILFLFFIGINITNAGYEFNESNQNLTLERVGWCTDLEVIFTAWNENQYEDIENIQENLCEEDETPEDDHCDEFLDITGTYTIYNGPLDSLPIFEEGTIGDDGIFKVFFTQEQKYLIEVYSEDNEDNSYNDHHELYDIMECKEADPTKVEQTQYNLEYFNHSFNFPNSELTVNIENTPIKESAEIKIEDLSSIENKPSDAIKTLKISAVKDSFIDKNYSKLDFEFDLDFTNSIIKVYKFDSAKQSWNEITYTNTSNKLILESIDFGIYSITKESTIIIENSTNTAINNEETNNDELETEAETTNLVDETEIEQEESKAKLFGFVFLGLIGVIILIITILKISHKKEIQTYNQKIGEKETSNPIQDVLTTYNDTYNSTKQYILQYKASYTKEQLITALKTSNVPTDIIDKVISEEY